jgi:hypothetical protein
MSKRKNTDITDNIKRHCGYDFIKNKFFGDLPDILIINILERLDIIDLKRLEICFPCLNTLINKVNFKINLDDKSNLLIKSFKSFNIDIIKYVFDKVKYENINMISITESGIRTIIKFCIHNNFFEGIDFLIDWKETHENRYTNYYLKIYTKKIANNQSNQTLTEYLNNCEELYYRYNKTNILEITINEMFYSNNVVLFDYIMFRYSNKYNEKHYKVFDYMQDHIELLFDEGDNDIMLTKYLEVLEKNIESAYLQINYEDIFYLAIQYDRHKCLNIMLNKFILTEDSIIDDIYEVLYENKFSCFDIIYNHYKELFTPSIFESILEDFAYDEDVVNYIQTKLI